MTQFYFKWDGRTGITGIIGITMIQVLLLVDVFTIFNTIFLSRNQTKEYVEIVKWIVLLIYFILLFFNYKKFNGKFNSLRSRWKDETRKHRLIRGFLVILALIAPWIPVVSIGIYWDR